MPLYDFRYDMKEARAELNKPFEGISSGIEALDNSITGFTKGDLSIIAGRPGLGKSSLARNILLHNSMPDKDHGVGFLCTMEMKCWEVYAYMSSTLSHVCYEDIKKNLATQSQVDKFDKTCNDLLSYKIKVQDDTNITPDTIRLNLDVMLKVEPVSVLIVDYLQLMTLCKPVESRQLEITEISRELKRIGMEYNIPVIALSQLNRNVEYRESGRPRLIDLRESGAMEQDASIVILIHRPSYSAKQYDANAEDDGEVELIIPKCRRGKTSVVNCAFIGEYTTFCDLPEEF
jgi:replicative DNA helicase